MRYVLTALLALAVGITAIAPAALAQTVDHYGNLVVPLQQPGGNGGGTVYVDGVARSSVQPATVTLSPAAGLGAVAGAMAPNGPSNSLPFYGGDRN